MKIGLLIIYCLFLLTGCRNNNSVPAGIIPQKKMQAILWDLMRADQFLGDFVLNKDSSLKKNTESLKLYQKIFSIHHISIERFRESFSFYKTHPSLFKSMMDSLSRPVSAAPTKMVVPVTPEDSIQTKPKIFPVNDTVMRFRKKKRPPMN
jgi:Domain of unknown function (DUF4296)